jgi:methylamine dehydrogenase accessory protein MauD
MERLFLFAFGAGCVLIVVLGLMLAVSLWMLGEILLKSSLVHHALITDEGPALHRHMPEFAGHDLGGRQVALRDYRGRDVVILFLSAECSPCEALLGTIRSTERRMIDCPDFVAVLEGSRAQGEDYVRRFLLDFPVLLDETGELMEELGIVRAPYTFLVDADGVVRMKGVANNRRQLEGLIAGRGNYLANVSWRSSIPRVMSGS